MQVLTTALSRCMQVHLDERCSRDAGLPLVEVRWVGAQLCLALEALHELHYLHRDLKPSNVRAPDCH